jgi:hypothetical protein
VASKPNPDLTVNPNPTGVPIQNPDNPVDSSNTLNPAPISTNISSIDTGGVNSTQNHAFSDLDASILAQHHTLGNRPNQSSPGNHDHGGQLGLNIPAASIKELQIANLGTFTPTWTGGGTAPILGNGSIGIQYIKLGNLVIMWFDILAGTTTTFGTAGAWTWTLPFPQNGGFPGSGVALIHNNARDWNGSLKLVGGGFQIAADANGGAGGSNLIGSSVNDPAGSAWLANSFFARVQYTYMTLS